jgi:predicted transposase YdaD
MARTLTIEQVFENVGWTAKWEARGKTEGRTEGEEHKAFTIAQNMVNMGLPLETIVSATQLDPEKVKTLYLSKEKVEGRN